MSTFREPVFNLDELTNSDTVITWLNRTNQLINSVNSFYLIDTFDGQGICSTRADGVVTLNIDAGPGLGFNASNELVLDYSAVTELSSATTTSPINSTDYLLIQRSGVSYKVKADSVLPTTIKHKHTFSEQITIPDLSASTISFGSNPAKATISHVETDTTGHYPRGFYFKTHVKDSGINLNPESFIRNYYPEYIATSDGVPGWTQPTTIVPPDEIYFKTAVFNFATHSFRTHGEDEFSLGELLQDKLALRFYTGIEGNNGDGTGFVTNPVGSAYDSSSTSLRWPMRWSLEFDQQEFTVKCDEGYRIADGGTGNVVSQNAFTYTYNQSETESIFSITGKIYISNLANSSQFVTAPNGANKVPLTNSSGVLNKKFTNRIVTSDYTSFVVGNLVCVGTITDGDITYTKAQASPSGNNNVIGIVESINSGIATIVINGEFELSSVNNLEAGAKYYLSQTSAGQYVVEGTYTTGILKAAFIATGTNKGILLPASANEIGISSITTFNEVDSSTEVLEIDSANYNLPLVGGPNIKLDVTSDNEIQIRVIDLAGAQDTFKYIQVDGVGGTDGDALLNADIANDTLYFTSSTLRIFADNTTKTINFEAPNSFTTFKFSGTEQYEYVAEKQNDILHFVAGNGIIFTENTDDSIIISASLDGVVDPTDVNYGGGLRVFASDAESTGTYVSLLGGDSEFFNANHANYSTVNVALNSDLFITRDTSNPSVTDKFVYDGSTYFLNSGGNWPTTTHSIFLPDELAGYVMGRITPSHSGDDETQPDDRIRRLSRRDLRFFLGISGDGYIDTVNSVFNQWQIYGSGSTISASSKTDVLIFEGGTGIQITNGAVSSGPNRIKITNTGIAQNAFSSVVVKNSAGTTIDSFDANSSADSFVLKSGNFVTIDTDTNNDTAIFDISIDDDYVLLGNPGTTDGINVIDLSSSSSCLVGRAGGHIEAITNTDLRWTGTTTATLTKPNLELPYFGVVQVDTSPTPTMLNADGTNKGVLRIAAGNSNITLTADTSTNTLTISSSGNGQGPSTTGVNMLYVNSSQYNYGAGVLTELKFIDGNGVAFSSSLDGTNRVSISPSLQPIPAHTILGNGNLAGSTGVPGTISFSDNTVLAKLTGGNLAPLTISAASGTTSLKNSLGIRHYTATRVVNNTGITNATALGTSTAADGATLSFTAGTNITLTTQGSTSTLTNVTINSATVLNTDADPIFTSIEPAGTTISYNKVTYGQNGKITSSPRGILQFYELHDTGTSTNIRILSKETVLPTNKNVVSVSSPGLGVANVNVNTGSVQEFVYNSAYTFTVLDRFTGASTKGSYSLDAGDITFTGAGTISFAGGGSLVGFGSKFLKATSANNSIKFITDNSSVLNICAFQNGASVASTTPNANIILHGSGNIKFGLAGNINSSTNWLQIASASSTDQAITSSGALTFNTNITFTSGTTLTFTGVNTVGLSPSAHAGGTNGTGDSGTVTNTHKSVTSEASSASVSNTDKLFAWHVGGVTRHKPTMLNTIGIVNNDGFYDFDLSAVSKALLYSGGTAFNSTNYSSSITTTNKGPLYLVVPNGTNPTTAGVDGPPGQIIFVKAT